MSLPKVKIVEVGLRDGLQNESFILTPKQKIEVGKGLIESGIQHLEGGAFVRADRIPQMANSFEVLDHLFSHSSVKSGQCNLSALVPNKQGMKEAMKLPLKEISIFTAASEIFTKANINCTINESFIRFQSVMETAKAKGVRVRGYLSTAFGCPYEKAVNESKVITLVERLFQLGCYEVSIGDTIGVATPLQVKSLISKLQDHVPLDKIAGHFHDTRGIALANVCAAYEMGVKIFDSSVGGLGGCPYAKGSAGNVATEEMVYLFDHMHVQTGIDLERLILVSRYVSSLIGRELPSRVSKAGGFVFNATAN